MMWSQFDSAGWLMEIEMKYGKLREGKEEEFLAALKEHGLFQLTEEGMKYFFEDEDDDRT